MSDSPVTLRLDDAPATEALGAALARAFPGVASSAAAGSAADAVAAPMGAVLYLRGELGAGKTTCVRSLLRSLGVVGLIRSPTYTLVEVYESGGITCVHVDLYRLSGAADVEGLGIADHLGARSLLLVEWPEKGQGALPAPDLELALSYDGGGRGAALGARSACGRSWLRSLLHDTSLTPYLSNLT